MGRLPAHDWAHNRNPQIVANLNFRLQKAECRHLRRAGSHAVPDSISSARSGAFDGEAGVRSIRQGEMVIVELHPERADIAQYSPHFAFVPNPEVADRWTAPGHRNLKFNLVVSADC
jgi:hypothetical protein